MSATIQGTSGNATLLGSGVDTAFSAKLDVWLARLDSGVVQTTGFGDLGWRNREPTIAELSGSASGMVIEEFAPVPVLVFSTGTFDPSKCEGTIVLTATTGCTYTFTGLISNVNIDRPEADKCTVTFDFVSVGRITQVWT